MKNYFPPVVVFILLLIISPHDILADCRGCCSYHGGVVCVNGVTQCKDGTPLSDTCVNKGCNECGEIPDPDPVVDPIPDPDPIIDPTPDPDPEEPEPPPTSSDFVKIASFNIQVFGITKADKAEVMEILAETISDFDIVAIQEIRDESGTAIEELEKAVDAIGDDYSYVIGPRLGRTSSKEQYAFMYRTSSISYMSSYTFDDSSYDLFHREPFIASFSVKGKDYDFVLLTFHTDPDEATEEINAIPETVEDARTHFPDEHDFIILGDLNADCSYFDETDPYCTLRVSEYNWLISNGADTNLASSSCTYDRIIITEDATEDYTGKSGVYRFDQIYGLTNDEAGDVSDHYPVWAQFYVGQDSDVPETEYSNTLYFPHIASTETWETEIALINKTNLEQDGVLRCYSDTGKELSSLDLQFDPFSRREFKIGKDFDNSSEIGYMVFESNSDEFCGYNKFYIEEKYRAAIPATSDINIGDIYIPHIASNNNWWSGLSLLNTKTSPIIFDIEFDDGTTIKKTIAAKEHQAFTIRSLFGGEVQPNIKSAVIKNGIGIVGLELFGSSGNSSENYLSGILLKDDLATKIYYPHLASNTTWWTGIVACNPFMADCNLTITPYMSDGTSLLPQTIIISGNEKYVGAIKNLDFPEGASWFSILSPSPITGFELFGTNDGKQLGGYTGVGIQSTEGVFPKIESDGWTGIAFVNTESENATVQLKAYDDSGALIVIASYILNPYEKIQGIASNLFSSEINDATYIKYSSNKSVVGFQLNGSSGGMMLDGLPGR